MLVLTGVVFLQCGGRTDMSLHTVLAIAAPTLFRDYRENQVVTAARLAGKQVQVSGVVVSLDRDDSNGLVVSLNSGDAVLPVDILMLPSEKAAVSRLVLGDQVFVQCTEFSLYIAVLSGDGCVLK
ncbi:TPA: hypothetical protein SMI12_002165 [Serratia liquefaciens]|nr:hypothetical protein [Serratia liquefaciens]